MSGDFLSRWSRRKQAARRAETRPEAEPDESLPAARAEAGAPEEPVAAAEEEPTLSAEEIEALPKLDELTPDSDLSAFLRKGVPEGMRNAALRRMWSLDPAIRDFVGEARDYAWDWNTPGGVPGSGELLPGQDVRAMVRQVFGESEPERDAQAEPPPAATSRHRDREKDPEPSSPAERSAVAAQPDVADESGKLAAPAGLSHADERSWNAPAGTEPLPLPAAAQQESGGEGGKGRAKPGDEGAKPV